MIPIVKAKEPPALTKAKRAIRNTPDTTFNYTALRGENKREVLEALLAEQGHLCAYCTCRIGVGDHPATIEHLIPQNPEDSAADGELSLDYHNMVAVCDGRGGTRVTNDVVTSLLRLIRSSLIRSTAFSIIATGVLMLLIGACGTILRLRSGSTRRVPTCAAIVPNLWKQLRNPSTVLSSARVPRKTEL